MMMEYTPAELREDLLAIEDGERSGRSTLARWMTINRAEFSALLDERRPSWKTLAALFNAKDMRNGRGQPLTPERVRQTWHAVRTSAAMPLEQMPSASAGNVDHSLMDDRVATRDATLIMALDDDGRVATPAVIVPVDPPTLDIPGTTPAAVVPTSHVIEAGQASQCTDDVSQCAVSARTVNALPVDPYTQPGRPELSDVALDQAIAKASNVAVAIMLERERAHRLAVQSAATARMVRPPGPGAAKKA
jgi:hypothetical protein